MNLNLIDLFQLQGNCSTTVSGLSRLRAHQAPYSEYLVDQHESAKCLFLRTKSPSSRIFLDGEYKIESSPSGGWLLRPAADTQASYWIPRLPLRRKLDDQGHILAEKPADIEEMEAAPKSFSLSFGADEGYLDCIVWRLDDPELLSELSVLAPLERQSWYLWGSHTTYQRPADIYLHLIHGHIYENRSAWPHYWKICSENDAHALYVTITGLMRATGKNIYRLLRAQLAISVIDRLGKDGAFRHGEWSKDMESHYRLHASGIHLMMDHLTEYTDPDVAAALKHAAGFLAARADHTDLGAWFLHDDLELNPESMQKSPFEWKASTTLGKSPSNMLVLNTHLDTLVGLDRTREFLDDVPYSDLLKSATLAANNVLQLRPAEALYKMVSAILYLTFLPTAKARALPLHQRALKRIGWKWLAPRLHYLKTAFPRLVMPGGYIDRAVSLKGVADPYQSINLMDMLRFLRRHPNKQVDEITQGALTFTHSSGILKHWAETPQKAYALGFWAEALWHACTLYPSPNYRRWLAEAMLTLETKNMGLPPSVLGANAEAIPLSKQQPCPIPVRPEIRVANLSLGDMHELLLVNASDDVIKLNWSVPPNVSLQWYDAAGDMMTSEISIPARGWLHGRSG